MLFTTLFCFGYGRVLLIEVLHFMSLLLCRVDCVLTGIARPVVPPSQAGSAALCNSSQPLL
jgi:hypothetical protein